MVRHLATELPSLGVLPQDRLLVAFSGGADSTALLAASLELRGHTHAEVSAAHFDHRLDPGSTERAEMALSIAARLGCGCELEVDTAPLQTGRGGPEARARERRYEYLSAALRRGGADHLLTAHHADDQAETVLLRIASGSDWRGLAGCRRRMGPLLRPLLDVDARVLRAATESLGIACVEDPTNRDRSRLRNRARHLWMPHLRAGTPDVRARLLGVSHAARSAREVVRSALIARLGLVSDPAGGRACADLGALGRLPDALLGDAMAILGELAGRDYPPPAGAVRELKRQLRRMNGAGPGAPVVRVHAGSGRDWVLDDDRLVEGVSATFDRRPTMPPFSYRLQVPGAVEIPEISTALDVRPGTFLGWMERGDPDRTGLSAPPGLWTVRNRRPGDRLRPLGARSERRLKDLLIDRKIPREERDRLPLLVIEDRIAWVPGIAVAERFRAQRDGTVWIARRTVLPHLSHAATTEG